MIINNSGRILIVDDEVNTLKACTTMLKMSGFRDVITESDSRKVMDIMRTTEVDVIILDLFMPNLSGIDLLPMLRENYPGVPVIVASAAYELERAVECMKQGAIDYLVKPVENERLIATLQKALECRALNDQVSGLKERLINDSLDHPAAFEDIVTCSRKMRSIFQYLEVVANSPHPIMIFGESGTGKELIARAIYRLSNCSGELVSVNLAGLDDTMFSDTLFGHKRGAFTGADQARDGLIVKAAKGVILLDEIGDLSESSQIRLLRLIQEKEYYQVGSDNPSKSQARIICASNKDLKQLVADGKFRNDLYYRLNTHLVALPPLRNRKEDLPLLLEHFISQASKSLGIKAPGYSNELLNLLSVYPFPGNIRELQGMVFDAVARSRSSTLSQEQFRNVIASGSPKGNSQACAMHDPDSKIGQLEKIWGHFPSLDEAENYLIDTAMETAGGNQGIAASMLGLKRQTLNMRLTKRKDIS